MNIIASGSPTVDPDQWPPAGGATPSQVLHLVALGEMSQNSETEPHKGQESIRNKCILLVLFLECKPPLRMSRGHDRLS